MKICKTMSGVGGIASLSMLLASSALLPVHSAHAQDQTQSTTEAGGLEEIVVTARKRSEDIQTTPVQITAFTGAQTQTLNVRQFDDLRGLVPNLEVTPVAAGEGVNLTIRGIGQGSVQVNVDNKVGLYVNDMYIARTEGNELGFYDVDSTQILNGPQGTLFGKNTTAGALILTTKLPSNDDSGYIDAEIGNYNRLDLEGALNIPITDNVLTRFSFREQSTDGYIKHILDSGTTNNIDNKNARLQLRVTPMDNLTVDLLGEYSASSTNELYGGITTACNPNATYQKNYNALHSVPFCTAYPVLNNPYLIYGGNSLSIPTDSLITNTARGALYTQQGITPLGHPSPYDYVNVGTMILRINYEISDTLSVKSITGFRRDSNRFFGADTAPECIYCEADNITSEETSQEVDLNGTLFDGRLTFVAGLYYEYQNTGFLQDTGPDWIDPTGYDYAADNAFTSEAVFTQGTYKITDKLDLTLGARYNYDHKEANSVVMDQTVFSGAACGSFVAAFTTGGSACNGLLTGRGSHNWYDFDPRVQVDYRWTPDIMTYFNFSGGYNAGGFNQQLGTNLGGGLVPYGRERVWNYEGGLKSEWLENRLQFNVTGFYQTYDNFQTSIVVTYNGVTTRAIQNGANVHEDGVEASFQALPTPDLLLRGTFAFLDQAYDFILPGITAFTLTTPVTSAPRFEWSVGADYTFHLPSDATLVTDLNYRWVGSKAACLPTSGFVAGTVGINGCEAPSYGLLGGQLNYKTADGNWTIGLWATNMLNKLYYVAYAAGLNANMGETTVRPGVPQEYGIHLRRNFGGESQAAATATTAAYVPPPPQAPAPAVRPAPATARSYMVFFDFDKSDLTPQAVQIVDQAAQNAGPARVTRIDVTGHTDTVGSDAYNLRLSRRRADAVAHELETRGIPASEIEIIAKGKRDLLVPTGDGVREPQNRRVQIVYEGPTS